MNTPIQEVLMLLGDKVIIIHEKDKEIIKLQKQLDDLASENFLLKAQINGSGLEPPTDR